MHFVTKRPRVARPFQSSRARLGRGAGGFRPLGHLNLHAEANAECRAQAGGDGRTRGLAAPDGAERGDRRKPSVNKSESEETAKGNDGVEVAGRFHRRGQFAGVDERRADRRAGRAWNEPAFGLHLVNDLVADPRLTLDLDDMKRLARLDQQVDLAAFAPRATRAIAPEGRRRSDHHLAESQRSASAAHLFSISSNR